MGEEKLCSPLLRGTHPRHPLAFPPLHQLHHLVSDDVCLKVVELYLNEKKRGAAGGNLSSRCVRAARETSYQWKAERCMADENCFKVRGQPCSAPYEARGASGNAQNKRGPAIVLGPGGRIGLNHDFCSWSNNMHFLDWASGCWPWP